MLSSQINSSKTLFSSNDKRSLTLLLDSIIPASELLGLPSAAKIDFLSFIDRRGLFNQANELLQKINHLSTEEYSLRFHLLDAPQTLHIIGLIKGKHYRLLYEFVTYVVHCYYQQADILSALGLNKTCFPDGNCLNVGDLGLLEPVYERGKIYRETILA